MRQFTSECAKSLITIVGTEYRMAQIRVDRNFIVQDRMLGILFERLNTLACQNLNLRKFLDNVGSIPVEEDESMDMSWAKDPRTDDQDDEGPRYVTRESGNILNSNRRDSRQKARAQQEQGNEK